MWAAIFGDIFIRYGPMERNYFAGAKCSILISRIEGYTILLVLSFMASIFLEWLAINFYLWQYTPAMPSITIFNYEVGLSPIL